MALYVTDTHPLIWHITGPYRRLSKEARRIFQNAERQRALIYVPAIVLWEIALLSKRGKVSVKKPVSEWGEVLLKQGGFALAPLDLAVIVEASKLTFTSDAFDAAIVATARVMDLPLITKDEAIAASRLVEIAW